MPDQPNIYPPRFMDEAPEAREAVLEAEIVRLREQRDDHLAARELYYDSWRDTKARLAQLTEALEQIAISQTGDGARARAALADANK